MNRRRRSSNPLTIIILVVLIGGAVYVNQVVVPETPPLFVPTPTATTSAATYMAQADQLAEEGKFSQAIDTYNQAIIDDPKNPSNYLSIARLDIYLGEYQDAIDNAGTVLILNANNSTALALRGYATGLNGDFLKAQADLNQAIQLDPNNAVPYAYLAEVMALQYNSPTGDVDSLQKAIDYAGDAKSRSPDLLETHRALGIVYENMQRYDDAVSEFKQAIAINPNIAELHLELGLNYRAIYDNANAINEFLAASVLDPTDPDPYTSLSRTYANQGDYVNAVEYGNKAISFDPTNAYLYGNVGVMQYHLGDYPRALDALKLAVTGGTADSGDTVEGIPLDYWPVSEYYYTYGLVLARQGQCGDALPIANQLLKGVSTEQVSVDNANEIISICQQVANGTLPTDEMASSVEPTDASGATATDVIGITETPKSPVTTETPSP